MNTYIFPVSPKEAEQIANGDHCVYRRITRAPSTYVKIDTEERK